MLIAHPAYADWGVAVGTFALAPATVFLALQARSEAKKVADQATISTEQVRVSRPLSTPRCKPVLIDNAGETARCQRRIAFVHALSKCVPADAVAAQGRLGSSWR